MTKRRQIGQFVLLGFAIALTACMASETSAAPSSFASVIAKVQPKIVKIYGAGGLQGLEPYQSGFLVSSQGHVLTVWSYVLDSDVIGVTLDDGRKFEAELLGHDPTLEIAVLKIEATELPFFNLDDAAEVDAGARVLAFSNLYGVATGNEPASVLHGSVSVKTSLAARRGAFQTAYSGPVYVLDAMTNNPGAAGGALTDRQGRFVGLLGKELRNSQTNTWLNYALPASQLAPAVEDIRAGKTRPRSQGGTEKKPVESLTLALLGIGLVPDVLAKTPPFIDKIRTGSPAEKAGLLPDDLVLFVNNRIAPSCKTLIDELTYIERGDEVKLTVQRGQDLIEVMLSASN